MHTSYIDKYSFYDKCYQNDPASELEGFNQERKVLRKYIYIEMQCPKSIRFLVTAVMSLVLNTEQENCVIVFNFYKP